MYTYIVPSNNKAITIIRAKYVSDNFNEDLIRLYDHLSKVDFWSLSGEIKKLDQTLFDINIYPENKNKEYVYLIESHRQYDPVSLK